MHPGYLIKIPTQITAQQDHHITYYSNLSYQTLGSTASS
jgi:hypothetical protein